MAFHDEQVVYLDRDKEEIYNKVIVDVLNVVMENVLNFVIMHELDFAEQLMVYHYHVVLEVVYMQIDLLGQEILDDFYVVVVDHQLIVVLLTISVLVYVRIIQKDLNQVKAKTFVVELKVVHYRGINVVERIDEDVVPCVV